MEAGRLTRPKAGDFEKVMSSHDTARARTNGTGERILFLSWAVPPQTAGSALMVGNLAKQFSCEEMIVAGEMPYEAPAVEWLEDWPQVFYLIKSWPATWRGRRSWRRLLFPRLLIRSIFLARRYKCNQILVVFPDEEFLLAGYLTALWTGAKLYPYFHNTYLENTRALHRRIACWLQARVFSKASHVFVANEGMLELYRQHYPGLKCSALTGSLNEPLLDFSAPPEPGSPVRLLISGSIWDNCLDATVRICDAVTQVKDASLTFLSGMPRVFLQEMGLLRNGIQHESVSSDQVTNRVREADILVLPHGFSGRLSSEEYQTIFPIRTIEYLFSGRPILAHSPPECYLTRFLKENNCALVVDQPSVPALLEGLDRLRSDGQLRSDLVRNALRAAAAFQSSRVAATLRARLQRN